MGVVRGLEPTRGSAGGTNQSGGGTKFAMLWQSGHDRVQELGRLSMGALLKHAQRKEVAPGNLRVGDWDTKMSYFNPGSLSDRNMYTTPGNGSILYDRWHHKFPKDW